jgi:hypothetical protein
MELAPSCWTGIYLETLVTSHTGIIAPTFADNLLILLIHVKNFTYCSISMKNYLLYSPSNHTRSPAYILPSQHSEGSCQACGCDNSNQNAIHGATYSAATVPAPAATRTVVLGDDGDSGWPVRLRRETVGGGKAISVVTVSSAAPSGLADGTLYLRYWHAGN